MGRGAGVGLGRAECAMQFERTFPVELDSRRESGSDCSESWDDTPRHSIKVDPNTIALFRLYRRDAPPHPLRSVRVADGRR